MTKVSNKRIKRVKQVAKPSDLFAAVQTITNRDLGVYRAYMNETQRFDAVADELEKCIDDWTKKIEARVDYDAETVSRIDDLIKENSQLAGTREMASITDRRNQFDTYVKTTSQARLKRLRDLKVALNKA